MSPSPWNCQQIEKERKNGTCFPAPILGVRSLGKRRGWYPIKGRSLWPRQLLRSKYLCLDRSPKHPSSKLPGLNELFNIARGQRESCILMFWFYARASLHNGYAWAKVRRTAVHLPSEASPVEIRWCPGSWFSCEPRQLGETKLLLVWSFFLKKYAG